MPNTDKIFRDPLYNYIAIDKVRDAWVLELIDTPEVQRLRRIHQLGVSHFTYPGADHTRLCHTLGVLNLMQHSCRRVEAMDHGPDVERARHSLLAAAVLHDVGHGPFTDMLKAKDGDFFISDWLRNRNTVEFLGIWESVFNPDFNYGEFAIIRSQAGLNN